jgi:hypothetical protein
LAVEIKHGPGNQFTQSESGGGEKEKPMNLITSSAKLVVTYVVVRCAQVFLGMIVGAAMKAMPAERRTAA